jgi:hypothetical protein
MSEVLDRLRRRGDALAKLQAFLNAGGDAWRLRVIETLRREELISEEAARSLFDHNIPDLGQ